MHYPPHFPDDDDDNDDKELTCTLWGSSHVIPTVPEIDTTIIPVFAGLSGSEELRHLHKAINARLQSPCV